MLWKSDHFLICLLMLFFEQTAQTIIWTESFSNGCASGCLATSYGGWTEAQPGVNGAQSNKWFVSGAECGNDIGQCGTSCGGSDPSLHIGADDGFMSDLGASYNAGGSCGSGICVTTNRRIQSPVINCTGYSNLVLSFNFIHNGNQPNFDECRVVYSANGGATWTTLGVLPRTVGTCTPQGYWTNYAIDLPASANNNPNVKIGFHWINNDDGIGTDPSVAIDDIVVFAKPTYCYNSAFAAYTEAGCTNNCILTEFSALTPMCASTRGCAASCPATGPVMTQYFNVTNGCTATLTAAFQRRCNGIGCSACSSTCNAMSASNGCCSSGMDANDYLKVGGNMAPISSSSINLSGGYTSNCGSGAASTAFALSGNTITATGSNNGGAVIQWVQTGGVLFLEQRANRMDEIVTFTLQVGGAGCSCTDVVLPVDILSFWAETDSHSVQLKWLVKNEKHLSHYKVEKSRDGVHFYEIGKVWSENSYSERIYSLRDDNPYEGISYYKLTTVNKNNEDEKYIIRDVVINYEYVPVRYDINNEEIIFKFIDNPKASFSLLDLNGKEVLSIANITDSEYHYSKDKIANGVYIAIYFNGKNYYRYKMVIP